MKRAIAVVLLLSFAAFAQTDSKKSEPKRSAPVQKVDFTGEVLTGETLTPLGEIYLAKPEVKFESLIRVRMNFNDKLRESVHEM